MTKAGLASENDRSARVPWAAAMEACARYLERPNTPDLFRVFNPLVAHAALWHADAPEGHPDDAGFRPFDSALADGSGGSAGVLAQVLQGRCRTSVERATVRFALAGRALLTHDRIDMADAILSAGWARGDRGGAVAVDRFLFRMRCRVHDEQNEALLRDVLARTPQWGATAMMEHVRHCWRYEGASSPQLDRLVAWQADLPPEARDALNGECLAMAFRVDDAATVERLLDPGRLPRGIVRRLLPLASWLRVHGVPSVWRRHQAGIDELALLHEHIAGERVRLIEQLSAVGRTVALVGNSPCELGSGHGARIDAHDVVIRFNHYALDAAFAPDYGTRVDIHVRGGSDDRALAERSIQVGRTVLCQFDFEYLPRNWEPLLELRRRGASLTTLPAGFHHGLQRELGAEPSLGLAMCAFVHSLRHALPASSCFGFSFTDQIEGPAPHVRYFSDLPPAMTHRWHAERRIFERLLTSSTAGRQDPRSGEDTQCG